MEMRRRMTAALTLSCLLLAGCGWRFETPDPSPLVPDEAETLRDAAARAEARLIEALPYADPRSPGGEWLFAFEGRAAEAHLLALGGVYEPYPDPSPNPAPSDPAPSSNPASSSDPASSSNSAAPSESPFGPTSYSRYAAFARDIALEGALTAEDPDLALLLASIGLSHAAALRYQSETDARASGASAPLIVERLLPLPPGLADADPPISVALLPTSTSVSDPTLLDLVLLHDQAVYVCEVVAARAEGDLRWIAYQRSLVHEARADALVEFAGSDPRGPSYVTDRERLESNETMEVLLAEMEEELTAAYIAAFAEVVSGGGYSTADRGWLLSAAFDALVASLVLGVAAEEAAAFPGVSVPGYSAVEPAPGPSPSV